MKKITIKFLVILTITMSIWSCSTKKNTLLSRSFHSTVTKYNVLYNGKNAYNTNKKQIDDAYKDNYWKTLPIEPLKITEEKITLGPPGAKNTKKLGSGSKTTSTSGFSKAEEKSVKAIQRHSMFINNSEKNKQIDDSYFLLGKSRYYDQRFVPALETFKYMIKTYPKSKLFNIARVWEAKTLIRLGNEDEAVYKLDQYLTKIKDLSNDVKADAHTALAMAFTQQDSIQQVINHLNLAILYANKISDNERKEAFTYSRLKKRTINIVKNNFSFSKKNRKQAIRNAFVLAQTYRKQNKIDSSNIILEKIIKIKKAPRRYTINAQLERAKNYNPKTDDDAQQLLANLTKISKNRDNRPYLGGIFYQLGKINLLNNNTNEALAFFEKSVLTKQVNNSQKSYSYEELGNIYFDKANFQNAGSYYDSVLSISKNKNTKRLRKLTRKRKGLNEVIRLENIASKNDSILNLASMSKEEQTVFFKNYIKLLKKKDEEAKIIAQNKNNTGSGGFGNIGNNNTKGSKFYFYNPQTLGFGQQEFTKIWGKRTLADNWRLSNKKTIDNNDDDDFTTKNATEDVIDDTKKYDIAYYLEKIPTKQNELDSISAKRNKAYYNLGLIYKEQFNKYQLATTRLEKLLTLKPNKNLILPTYYHLYKSFEKFNAEKSDYYKNKILNEYADSKYAQIINDPNTNAISKDDENSPEEIYKKVYILYLDKNYQNTFSQCKQYIKEFSEMPIVPKFELLKAHAIAKLKGREDYITALNFVLVNYPNTIEGKRAAEILAFLRGEKPTTKKEEKEVVKKPNKPASNKQKINRKRKTNTKNLPSKEEMMRRIKNRKKGSNIGPPGLGG